MFIQSIGLPSINLQFKWSPQRLQRATMLSKNQFRQVSERDVLALKRDKRALPLLHALRCAGEVDFASEPCKINWSDGDIWVKQ